LETSRVFFSVVIWKLPSDPTSDLGGILSDALGLGKQIIGD